jgi:hypothetical protein
MEDGEVIEEKPPLLREAPHERTEDLLTSAPPWQGEPLSDPQATKAIQVLEACNSRDVKVLSPMQYRPMAWSKMTFGG